MTLRELLLKKGLIHTLNQRDMLCPFHDDHSPSATLFTNDMKCWSKCGRTYTLIDFQALFGPDAMGLTLAPEEADDRPQLDKPKKMTMFVY